MGAPRVFNIIEFSINQFVLTELIIWNIWDFYICIALLYMKICEETFYLNLGCLFLFVNKLLISFYPTFTKTYKRLKDINIKTRSTYRGKTTSEPKSCWCKATPKALENISSHYILTTHNVKDVTYIPKQKLIRPDFQYFAIQQKSKEN